jgi:catechol 2,3-dioxygenase-like lactoylglutathione lyase family enzyme
MLHHLSLAVADLDIAAAFYDAALRALGYRRVWTAADAIGYGMTEGEDKLAIKVVKGGIAVPGPGFHVAFAAPSREAVDRFHAAALRHGGRHNGAPGLRTHYGPHYYAAFVFDPDGHRLEAVMNEVSN